MRCQRCWPATALFCLLLTGVPPARAQQGPEVVEVNKRDILFLVDGTSSLGQASFNAIREFLVKVIQTLEVGQDLVQVAVAQYADTVRPEFYFNTHPGRREVVAALRRMKPMDGAARYTGSALDLVRDRFFSSAAGHRASEGVPKLLVLITGGRSLDDVSRPAQRLHRAGIMAFAVGSKAADEAELREVAFDNSLVFVPAEFRTAPLHTLLPRLVALLRTFSGITEGEGLKRDVLFLLDGSANLVGQFPAVRDFLYKIVRKLSVGPSRARVGVVQFSDEVHPEFYLKTHRAQGPMLEAIRRLRFKGGAPLNTGKALEFVARNLFVKSAGSRIEEGVPQFLVLISSGRSSDEVDEPAAELKRAGVAPLTVARNADREELLKISLSPEYVFSLSTFRELPTLEQKLLTPIATLTAQQIQHLLDASTYPPPESKRDVLFLLDGSANLVGQFPAVRDFLYKVVEELDMCPGSTRVAVAQFSDDVRVESRFSEHQSKAELLGLVKRLKIKTGKALNLGYALDFALRQLFVRAAGSRVEEGVMQFLVLLVAGRSSDGVAGPAQALRQSGVVPFVLQAKSAEPAELEQVVPSRAFILVTESLPKIGELQPQIVNLLKTVQNGAVAPGVGGKRDVVFLIDGSQATGPEFQHIRTLLERLVGFLDVGLDTTRVSVVQFSEDPWVEFLLNTHSSKEEVLGAVKALRPKGGRQVHLGTALKYVTRNIFRRPLGSRIEEGVPQFLVLISSGRSSDEVDEPAAELKRAGVAALTVARNADREELLKISLSPEYVFSLSTFRELPSLEQKLLTPITTLTAQQIQQLLDASTYPPPGVGSKRDVVFLIDGSQAAGPEFQHVRTFLERLVGFLDVGLDTTRVSVIQFSEDPWVEFLLNTHSSKEEVLGAVKALRPKGGRQVHLGTALKYVTRNIFRRPLGSRIEEGVPQFLVLISSGRSSDEVDEPAAELKRAGVAPLTVARNADREELLKISLSPEYVFSLSTFRELPSLEQKLLTPITTLTTQQIQHLLDASTYPPPGVGSKRDVVFLIDSSQAADPEFQHVRTFLERLVGFLDVGLNTTRVSVVQFSEYLRVEFLLNTHSSKEEVLGAVKALQPKGGRQVHLGTALKYVTRNIFRRPLGSRIEEGVPQFLVLISSGRSSDEVDEPAAELKRAGVAPLTVARNADHEELLKISLSPEYVFSLSTFRELPSLEQKLLTPITTLTAQQIQHLLDASTYPPPGETGRALGGAAPSVTSPESKVL
ncbi:collagen alpha-3(VI) chain-like [Sorex fumeus]|uniref:collagen alpha-3(VI) chain-like n=1 Tax=Sorex fumeus TaxID=62283 RepID=UPI0024ADB03D|nr:collagen alpha-3(VI) chain-like [Sorex fumeus]